LLLLRLLNPAAAAKEEDGIDIAGVLLSVDRVCPGKARSSGIE